MQETKNVKDYSGKLIPRDKARKIDGLYYLEGVSCILMPDGQWYRTTTDKIRFDWETNKWVFTRDTEGLTLGLVDDGSLGCFSASDKNVRIAYKKDAFVRTTKLDIFGQDEPERLEGNRLSWVKKWARTSEIAEKFGYVESIFDGIFYKKEEMSAGERAQATKPGLPANEKSNTYSLDDDPETKKAMEKAYAGYNPVISRGIRTLSRYLPYSFGIEYESSTGFVPARLRSLLGIRALRDGSISGIEYVTIPLIGAKGIQTTKETCAELTKRCDIDLKCSVHTHYGNVRRDKPYIISLWTLGLKLQDELLSTMPFSRLNSIRGDGKVYCKKLPDVDLHPEKLLKAKSGEEYKKACLEEFNKIYSFLNAGHPAGEIVTKQKVREEKVATLGGREQKVWRFAQKVVCYSTKSKAHAIRGHKWDRPQRYYWLNLLPTFFSSAETIEFRPHEATTNFEKTLMWMLTCTAILEYAKNIEKVLSAKKITLEEVLKAWLPESISAHILDYYTSRRNTFMTGKNYKQNWEVIENDWISSDKRYKFNNKSIEDLL